ncbi:MAG: hypothetical protein DRI01_02935 [Chloroflexi bacterium]|nr:MAG: hypothetical protein DRI01_02935 [Chloroflexota bacterium]
MDGTSNMKFANHKLFRWLARVFIFVSALIPVFFNVFYFLVIKELGPKYWKLGESMGFSGPLLVIAIIASIVPIAGGPLAIVWSVLGLVFGSAMDLDQTFVFLTYGTFLLGGILCTLWGWQWRKEKRGQA